jgi:hypothetical protein
MKAIISHIKHRPFTLEGMSSIERLTPMSASREPSPHQSGAPTDSPHMCHRKKEEEDPHLHINNIQQEQNLSDYAQQDLFIVT